MTVAPATGGGIEHGGSVCSSLCHSGPTGCGWLEGTVHYRSRRYHRTLVRGLQTILFMVRLPRVGAYPAPGHALHTLR